MSDSETKFTPPDAAKKIDLHIPNPDVNLGQEKPDVLEQIKRGEIAANIFFGQTEIFIPNSIVDIVGEQKILELAKEVYGEEEYEAKDGIPIRLHRFQNSRTVELPRCPFLWDKPGTRDGHFDRTKLDNFIDKIKEKFTELSTAK